MEKFEKFNMVVAGVGGQGILTVAGLIARAALAQGYDIKASEIHGLAMRFGALECHLRLGIGKKVWSPLIKQGGADLIVALEPVEALRVCYYANPNTSFLIDTKAIVPNASYLQKIKYPSIKEITGALKKVSPKGKVIAINASEAVKAATGSPIAANVFLVGRVAAEGLVPVKKELLAKALEEIFPPKLLEMNKKVFELGFASKHKI